MATAEGAPDGYDARDAYDAAANEYARQVAWRERGGAAGDPLGIAPPLLELLGDVAGRAVLDAGCGEGYLARLLAARGARVVGVDLSPRLVALARARDPEGAIDYRAADLSAPRPELAGRFAAVASCLVLNDIADHRGFAATLAAALRSAGRLVVALNNPYSYVVRKHAPDYFAAGEARPYRGMAAEGVVVRFYQRTLGEYLAAFLATGLRLTELVDLDTVAGSARMDTLLPEGYRFPYFMLLGFVKG